MTRRTTPFVFLCIAAMAILAVVGLAQSATHAPAAFATPLDNAETGAVGNGFSAATFTADMDAFMEEEDIPQGIGPTYNARGCVDCHQQPNVGGSAQVTELRVGHNDANGNFVNPNIPINDGANSINNRSLVNDRSICAQAAERVPGAENVRATRSSLNVLGDGFVEAIDSNTLNNIANAQPGQSGGAINGLFIQVPVAEAGGAVRGGRFGWKNQQASLVSFAADAYVNEMGVTSPLQPTDNTSNGTVVSDGVADPEDAATFDHPNGADVEAFAR